MVYDPQRASGLRAASLDRLMALLDSRRQESELKHQQAIMDQQAQEQLAKEQQGAWNGMGNMFGSAAQGAAIGTMFGPGIGTAIGGGAGLLIGAASEMKNRHDFQKMAGKEGYGWGDSMKDTFLRAPNLHELGSMVSAGASIGAGVAGKQRAAQQNAQAAQDQALRQWRASQPTQVYTDPQAGAYGMADESSLLDQFEQKGRMA